MRITSVLWGVLLAMGIATLFSGCQSSKVAYGNRYYFKQTPRPVAVEKSDPVSEVQSSVPEELQVSLQPELLAEESKVTQAQAQLEKAIAKSNNEDLKKQATRVNRLAEAMKVENSSERDKKEQRRELRKELKQLKKELRAAPNETNDMDRNLRIALILLVAGLVLGLIPLGPLNIVGWIAFVAGLVFLIIWLVNEA